MKHMPLPRPAERVVPRALDFFEVFGREPGQQRFDLGTSMKGAGQAVGLQVPLVAGAEELAREAPAGTDRIRQARPHRREDFWRHMGNRERRVDEVESGWRGGHVFESLDAGGEPVRALSAA